MFKAFIPIGPRNPLERIQRWFQFQAWSWKVMWHAVLGRRYYFRNYPLWFVVKFAAANPADHDDDFAAVIRTAQAELELRIDRIKRELENLPTCTNSQTAQKSGTEGSR